jgi:arabinogalactan oligomer/maltooligosaccharide transport system permease protein
MNRREFKKSTFGPAAMLKRLILILACALTLLPLVWILSASFSERATLFAAPLWPENPTFANYAKLLGDTDSLRWVLNSVIVCGGAALVSLMLTTGMAYAFSRLRFRGRRMGLLALFLLQMIPSTIMVMAMYYLLLGLGLLNSFSGLILAYAGLNIPFSAWLLKGFFDSIPTELEESAFIDGATRFQAAVRIILPLALPMMAAIFLFNVIAFYNDYIIASVVLTGSENYTVGLGLRFFQSANGADWALFSAGAIAGALPLVILFYSMQRFLVGGLTAGAVKG